jgi:hypothetical protein
MDLEDLKDVEGLEESIDKSLSFILKIFETENLYEIADIETGPVDKLKRMIEIAEEE